MPNSEESPLSSEAFRSGQVVLDLVYSPRKTRFLQLAEEQGAQVVYGDQVFLEQALEQDRIFLREEPPREELQKILEAELL